MRSTETIPAWRVFRRFLPLAALVLGAPGFTAAPRWTWAGEASSPPGRAGVADVSKPAGTTATSPGAERDRRLRRLVLGVWQDNYQGRRTMTLREDGTGEMLVELSGLKAALFAARLRFDMEWSVQGARLKKRTVGGEPASKVQWVLKTMGDRVDEPILELTANRLLLLDKDGKTKYDWRRPVESQTPPKE